MSTATIPDAALRKTESQPLPRLDADANGILMSPAEFDAIEEYDEDFCYELIRGVVIVSAWPLLGERDPNEELGRWLRNYAEDHPQGRALDFTVAESYVPLPDGSRRRADRLIWCGLGRFPNVSVDMAAIAVEFVSKRRRDYQRDFIDKRREYLSVGIREYWIVDRFRRHMTVFLPDGSELVVSEDASYESPLLPGFVLSVGRLLQVADRSGEQA